MKLRAWLGDSSGSRAILMMPWLGVSSATEWSGLPWGVGRLGLALGGARLGLLAAARGPQPRHRREGEQARRPAALIPRRHADAPSAGDRGSRLRARP